MRVLFSTTAGSGHFGPMVPFARACQESGHEVRVAAPESFAGAVAAAGLDHAPFADVAPEVLGPIFARLPALPPLQANSLVIADIFGRLDAQTALPGLTEIVAGWRPDLVVREFCELGSLVAAHKAGIPQVEVAIGLAAAVAFARPVLTGPLAELDSLAGLAEGTAGRALDSVPVLSCIPGDLDGDDRVGRVGPVWRFRDPSSIAEVGSLPAPWGDQDHPLVYVTFGSVAAGLPPFAGLYRATLEALADQPVRVLMTTASAAGEGSLGPSPANARIEQWWPQAAVMPHAAAVVGHGGFGTTMAALAAGVPQVVVPLFAFDQFVNAERVAEVGAGMSLEGGPDAISKLAPALAEVLHDSAYRDRAEGVAAAIAELPDVATSVPFLEQVAN